MRVEIFYQQELPDVDARLPKGFVASPPGFYLLPLGPIKKPKWGPFADIEAARNAAAEHDLVIVPDEYPEVHE